MQCHMEIYRTQLNHTIWPRVRTLVSLSRCYVEELPRVPSGERETISSRETCAIVPNHLAICIADVSAWAYLEHGRM